MAPRPIRSTSGLTAVLHTWGSALTHHPHLHCIVPRGGIALDGQRWVACRRGFFLPVRVLSRLFRRLFCDKLAAAHQAGELQFFAEHAALAQADAFAAWLRPLRLSDWVVHAKRPFAGPQAVLACLSRYTHRVAIANDSGPLSPCCGDAPPAGKLGDRWIPPADYSGNPALRRSAISGSLSAGATKKSAFRSWVTVSVGLIVPISWTSHSASSSRPARA